MRTFLPDVTSPRHPHLSTVQITGRPVTGGLVDGPVAARVFASLEPTLDGTASTVLLLALIG